LSFTAVIPAATEAGGAAGGVAGAAGGAGGVTVVVVVVVVAGAGGVGGAASGVKVFVVGVVLLDVSVDGLGVFGAGVVVPPGDVPPGVVPPGVGLVLEGGVPAFTVIGTVIVAGVCAVLVWLGGGEVDVEDLVSIVVAPAEAPDDPPTLDGVDEGEAAGAAVSPVPPPEGDGIKSGTITLGSW
jgi:hypothetical protein